MALTVPLIVHRWTDPLQQQPEFPDVLEWHPDERQFVDVVLKTIAGTVTTKQPGGARRATKLTQLRISDEKPEPDHFMHHAVHLLPEYRLLRPTVKGEEAHATLFDEIADSFAECGVTVLETPQKGAPSVIVASAELYERPEVVQALVRLLPANDDQPGGGVERMSQVRLACRRGGNDDDAGAGLAASLSIVTTITRCLN